MRELNMQEVDQVNGGLACGGICVGGLITAGGFAAGLGTSYAINNWM